MTNSKALEALNRIKTIYPSGIMASVYGQCTASMMALKQDLDELQLALTELEEIKKRAEEKHTELESKYARALIIAMKAAGINEEDARENMGLTYKHNLIDYILKGEAK